MIWQDQAANLAERQWLMISSVAGAYEILVSGGQDTEGDGHARWAAPGPCQLGPETPPQVQQSSSQHNHSHYMLSITKYPILIASSTYEKHIC